MSSNTLGDSSLNIELPPLTAVLGIVVDHIHIRLPESLEFSLTIFR